MRDRSARALAHEVTTRPSRIRSSPFWLSAILAASIAGTIVALVLRTPAPATLDSATPDATVPLTTKAFDDGRQAQLHIVTGAPRAVTSPRTGRLTDLDCQTGGLIHAGTVPASVDGRPMIAISTTIPLWRNLAVDDRGDDVAALQSELTRLGHPTSIDGVMGASTLRAVESLRAELGLEPQSATIVDVHDFIWIPRAEVTVRSCLGVVGAPVADGDALAELPVDVVSARLITIPTGAAPGQRVLRSNSLSVAVDDSGGVTDPEALAQLAASPEFESATTAGNSMTIPVRWMLSSPVTATVVPPSSLWDIRDGKGCVQPKSGPPRVVDVIGSELGQTFITSTSGEPLTAVFAQPEKERSCR